LVRRDPRRRVYEFDFMDTRIYVQLFTPEELDKMISEGSLLGFMLKYSVVVLDRGCLSMVRSKPRITEFTVRSLRRSTLAALGLAIESFLPWNAQRVCLSSLPLDKALDQVPLHTLRRR
jgi:hypothetical protein